MHFLKLIILISSLTTLTGCHIMSAAKDSYIGLECIMENDIEGSIVYLERATKSFPRSSSTHFNLAYAYMLNGDLDKGWLSARRAAKAECRYGNELELFTCCYEAFVKDQGIDVGISRAEVEEKLGYPDAVLEIDRKYLYGLAVMVFQNDKLSSVYFLEKP